VLALDQTDNRIDGLDIDAALAFASDLMSNPRKMWLSCQTGVRKAILLLWSLTKK
jgi:hypothetical protein